MTNERVRLTLLLALLASLAVYVVTSRASVLGLADGPATAGPATPNDCPAGGAPSVASVSRTQLLGLREGLHRMMFLRGHRLYEEGPVASSYMWSDGEPGRHRTLPPGPRDPGGYEMRWWLANGDDVVADVMVFAGTGQARDFFERTSSTRCRRASARFAVPSPLGGRDVVWRNPDGFAQEDVYLLRGQRVYRVAVVQAGAKGSISPAARRVGFALVNGFACVLPAAACQLPKSPALLAAAGHELLSA